MVMKLNIGCGTKLRDDAIKADIREGFGDVRADIRALPFENGVFDEIIAHDVIEHLTVADALAALREVARVLRVGGRVEFQLPSLKGIFEAYAAGAGAERVSWWLYGGQDYEENYHKAVYDKGSFERMLAEAKLKLVEYEEHGTNMIIMAKKGDF